MKPTAFFQELRRRHVVRVAIAYVVVGFGVLQGVDLLTPALSLPGWTVPLAVILLLAGLPVALVLAWAYSLPPGAERGIVETIDASGPSREEPSFSAAVKARRVADDGAAERTDDARRSIAVLPMLNLSDDRGSEYFSDGLAEEILNVLSRLPQLRVASRTSSFSFRDSGLDVRTIAARLGVQVVLEGSVRRAGNRVRITVQLIDADADCHLWSETYDRLIEDVFAVQDDIAARIARALELRLTPQQRSSIRDRATTRDVHAYDLYLRGRKYFHQWDRGGLEFAREMFRKAIDVDPGFARAYAGLADVSSTLCQWYDKTPEEMAEAEAASRKALELAPELAEAHASRGFALSMCADYEEAEREFEEAIRLDPMLFEAHYLYARSEFAQGHLDRAAELFGKAASLRPEDYQSAALEALAYDGLGMEAESREAARRAVGVAERHLEFHPDDSRALTLGAGALLMVGERERGLEWVDRAVARFPDDAMVLHNAACVYARAGETDRALDAIESRIRAAPMMYRAWIEHDPDFDPIRDHPRFRKILDHLP
ncbi:MAG: tetratricopeptide repeat protein [Gemmatimonadota bacterium]